MLHMTVKGKYVYEIRWINGDIEFEDQGTVDKPKPKIEAVDIINKTSDTITVKVTTQRNEGGTLKCYIKEENADYVFVKEQIEGNNTFEIDIESDTTYSNIKVEAIAKNGETASKEVEIVNIPTLTEKTVTLSYEVKGETINETDWTQGPVVVTVSTETEGYTLQTSQDGNTWKDAEIAEQIPSTSTKISSRATTRTVTTTKVQKSTQTFTTNGTLYARLIDKTTGQKGKEYTKKITNIDRLEPKTITPTATSTTNSITLTGSTEDATATNENASSGIAKYYFSKDAGATWEPTNGQTGTSYTFSNLTTNTYSLKMKVVDNAGNETTSSTITQKTGEVPAGESNITFSYSKTDWTNESVDVTITKKAGNETYKLQYKKDDGEWTTIESGGKVPFTTNGDIVARLADTKTDGTILNTGEIATGNVTKIDKVAPTISTATPLTATSTTTNSIALKIKVQDKKSENAPTTETISGLGKIIWYYKKPADSSYTSITDTYQASGATAGTTTEQEKTKTLTDLVANVTYSIYAEVYDVAGNKTTSSIITPTTGEVPQGEGNITFSYSKTDWTSGSVDVTITKKAGNEAYKLQYKKDDGEWTTIESGGKVPFTTNGDIVARLADTKTDGTILNTGAETPTASVRNIDTVKPTVSKQLAVVKDSTTTNSIKVSIETQDKKANTASTTETVSGLDKIIWYYKKSTDPDSSYENKTNQKETNFRATGATGATQGPTTSKTEEIEFTDLSTGTYNMYAEVYDVAGKKTRSPASGTINATTKDVLGGATNIGMGGLTGSSAIGIDYELANWTSKDVNVTLTNKTGNSNYKLQYKKDNGEWQDYKNPVTFTENGTIVARLTDNLEAGKTGNVGATATGNVTKIDKVKPTVSKQLAVVADSTTTNSIEVSITTQDKKSSTTSTTETVSGLDKIIWYYKKSTDSNTSYNQNKKETTFRASGATGATQGSTISVSPSIFIDDLTSNTTYNIYAEVYDVAGNMTRSPASGTVNVATYTISYQGIGGTNVPADQMKIQGKDLTLSSTKPTRSGYWFKDWCIYNPSTSNYQNGVRMLRARGNIL